MGNKGILEIIKLNQTFYENHNESFDKSRSYGYWEGFEKTLNYLPQNLDILDLGCGNARFLRFLLEKNKSILSYQGYDNSSDFIQKNQSNYPNYSFIEKDIILNIDQISETFNTVVAFGITHHIPDSKFRGEWFKKAASRVKQEGVLILSFWNFETQKSTEKFTPRFYKIEEQDYFLGWKNDFKKLRYCHFFTSEEITNIERIFNDFVLLNKFNLDKNTYLILKRK
jgi:SAM-dependent methyltransferase